MDPLLNPFSPGAGAPPPELVGRDPILETSRILLGRIRLKRPEKSILLTGLRGVGKRVLLNEIERMAKAEVDPDRLSFTHTVRVLRRKLADRPAFSP